MSKRNLVIIFIAILILVGGVYIGYMSLSGKSGSGDGEGKNKTSVILDVDLPQGDETIGGQRDEFGCLGAAGYSWSEELEVCVRSWEITDEVKPAITMAVDELKTTSTYDSLTIIRFFPGNCDECYLLRLDRDGEFLSALVDIAENSVEIELTPQPIPSQEIDTARKLVREVAAQVFGNPRELQELEDVVVLWNTEDEELTYQGIAAGIKDNYNAKDINLVYSGVLENLRSIGYETDDYNTMSGTPQIDISRLIKDDIVCNIVKTNTPEDGSSVIFSCADVE